jgi:hypothetical protein
MDVEKLVAEHASSTGGGADALVNEALRFMWGNRASWQEWPPELEAWLIESVASPASPMTAADYDTVRQRTKERIGTAAA